jgi:hypothetical protein
MFWPINISAKAARKMLMKLTAGHGEEFTLVVVHKWHFEKEIQIVDKLTETQKQKQNKKTSKYCSHF